MSKRQKTTSTVGTDNTLRANPDKFVSPMIVMYGVSSPPLTLPPTEDEPDKSWAIYTPAADPLDFLQPLLALGVDAQDACVLWAKFKEGAIAIVGLARLVGVKPLVLANDNTLFNNAITMLENMHH
jgi:hypothetical protein